MEGSQRPRGDCHEMRLWPSDTIKDFGLPGKTNRWPVKREITCPDGCLKKIMLAVMETMDWKQQE